ncbi:MAG: sulfatase [Actinomycetota bacterium]|nr:sulfatase [Actinomycetota bacterium]
MRRAWVAVAAVALSAVAVAHLPSRAHATTAKPNIVFVLSDDQTIDGLARALPFLNRGPGGHWVRFPNATVNEALCCPSRATILSGQYAFHTGVLRNGDGARLDDRRTVATALHAAGYRTSLVGKYLNLYGQSFGVNGYVPPGWDDWHAYTSRVSYYDYSLNENGAIHSFGSKAADYSTDLLAGRAKSFVTTAPEPFYLQFTPFAPHVPSIPAPRYVGDTRFDGLNLATPDFNETDVSDKPAYVRSTAKLTTSEAKAQLAKHKKSLLALLALDDAVSSLYNALQTRGVLDRTVIVFMTDNGYVYGEHRLTGAKTCPYTECVGTQMLVRYPGATARTDHTVVTNADLTSTFADLAGTTPALAQDGRSLRPLLASTTGLGRDGVLIEWPGGGKLECPKFWGVRTQRWKYVEYATGERELYDEVNDPYELVNHAGDSAYASVRKQLATQLAGMHP